MKLLVWNKAITMMNGSAQAVEYAGATYRLNEPMAGWLQIDYKGGRTAIPLEFVAQLAEVFEPGDLKPTDAQAH